LPFLYADPKECTGCRICELFCAFFHEKALNPKKARLRVIRLEPGIDYPVACRHCEEPKCLQACPVGAIKRIPEKGLVLIDRKKCNGCKLCVEACPYSAIFIDKERNKVMKCDLCGFCIPHCPVKCLKIVS